MPTRQPLPALLLISALVACALAAVPAAAAEPYLVGRGITDITGPPVGLKMLGYVRSDQIDEGIHLRQYARAFVIAEPDDGRRLAIVTTDLQSITHSLVLSVLDKLRDTLGDTYRLDNVVIAATHTHAVPGGYWHYAADTSLGSPLYTEHFEALVQGIAASIAAAHADLRPGRILVATGDVEGAGANRSRAAYLNNPEQERAQYKTDIDTQMTLLRFEVAGQLIGTLNWHAVHPTSMSFANKLISGDNKGYAAYALEKAINKTRPADNHFVAAFAQSNCGDVTPHLNLQSTGPGKDDFESTQIIGQRMADAAARLLDSASEELRGPVDSRHSYVDMASITLPDEITHAGQQSTASPAYGYSMAAGSTEDGGGQPLFKEGMTKQDPLIEAFARTVLPLPPPTEEMRRAHLPKPILLAVGAVDPPALPQVLPLSVARIGQLAIVIGPAEYTTMSGRRFRAAVKQALPGIEHVVIAGYAGDYAGYVATREEYELQHYEGASTLFGPWTQAGYQEQFARLASDLAAGRASQSHAPPLDMRGRVRQTSLATAFDRTPNGAAFGDIVKDADATYQPGQPVTVTFWSGNPRGDYQASRQYAAIERSQDGAWTPVVADGDWDIKIRWKQPRNSAPATAAWLPINSPLNGKRLPTSSPALTASRTSAVTDQNRTRPGTSFNPARAASKCIPALWLTILRRPRPRRI